MKKVLLNLLFIGLVVGLSQSLSVSSFAHEGEDHAAHSEQAKSKDGEKAKAEKAEGKAGAKAHAHGKAKGKGKKKGHGCGCEKCDMGETCKEGCGESGHCGGGHKH